VPADHPRDESFLGGPGFPPETAQPRFSLEKVPEEDPDQAGNRYEFGTKAHALLCRRYVKGRDWYDFVWYTSRKIKPDLELLQNALFQQGPWAGRPLEMTPEWFFDNMGAAIRRVDWKEASSDVRRFVPTVEQPGLDAWSTEFFLYQLEQLKRTMRGE
jgi:hypothetical protein